MKLGKAISNKWLMSAANTHGLYRCIVFFAEQISGKVADIKNVVRADMQERSLRPSSWKNSLTINLGRISISLGGLLGQPQGLVRCRWNWNSRSILRRVIHARITAARVRRGTKHHSRGRSLLLEQRPWQCAVRRSFAIHDRRNMQTRYAR